MKIKRTFLILLAAALVFSCFSCKVKPKEDEESVATVDTDAGQTESVTEIPAASTEQTENAAPEESADKAPAPEKKTDPDKATESKTDNAESKTDNAESKTDPAPKNENDVEVGSVLGVNHIPPVHDPSEEEYTMTTEEYKEYIRKMYELPDVDGMPAEYYPSIIEGYNPVDFADLYAKSDYIVVGRSDERLVDCKQVLRNRSGNECSFEEAATLASRIERVFKIEKVLKGDPVDELTVIDSAITNGEKVVVSDGQYVEQPGNRYLLFLERSKDSGVCYTVYRAGRYDLDDPEYNEKFHVNPQVYEEVRKQYAALFKE